MNEISGQPYWQATYDKSGKLVGTDTAGLAGEIKAAGVQQLFVFSHGWNNNTASAEHLYQDMFGQMATAAAAQDNLDKIGFVGIFWPSIWFPDPPADKSAQVAAASAAGMPGQADVAVTGAQIAQALAPAYDDPKQAAALTALGALVDNGVAGVTAGNVPDATQQANLDQFHEQLKTLVSDPANAKFDDGESALINAADPKSAYTQICDAMGSAPPADDAQGLGDIFGKVWNGAKDALRAASYFEMKGRAGTVGKQGLGALCVALHEADPAMQVHLVGHSFGARLVSFALAGIGSAEDSPVGSLTLVQGAFSHWAFADATMPFGEEGALFGYRGRVHGPVISTFSEADWAVGNWYPKASFLAGDEVSAVESAPKWGGMGSDGAQWVPGPEKPTMLEDSGHGYGFAAGEFYRVDCNAVIADTSQSPFSGAHSDIRHPQVTWLPVCAAAGR